MSISKKEIGNLAWLARLQIENHRIPRYQKELAQILNLIDQLNAVDCGAVEPLAHPLDISARLRPDAVTEPDQRDRFQAVAPMVDDNYYLVPKVIE